MSRLVLLAALFLSLAGPAAAQRAEPALQIALSQSEVDITTGFNGADIAVFGTLRRPGGAIAILVRGPDRTMLVRRKSQVLGTWINTSSVEFRRVPEYYDLAVTPGIERQVGADALAASQIGVDALDFYAEDEDDPEVVELYRDALIRRRQEQGLLALSQGEVRFLSPKFFTARFHLPANLPTGQYRVEAFLFENGQLQSRQARSFSAGQVGFNARVYLMAHQHEISFGLMAVALAALIGWGAFAFLRRD